MQASVITEIDGGKVTITYESDPKFSDGLTQTELAETVVGLIPALVHATTYITFDSFNVAETMRVMADIWAPQETSNFEDDDTYWESEH